MFVLRALHLANPIETVVPQTVISVNVVDAVSSVSSSDGSAGPVSSSDGSVELKSVSAESILPSENLPVIVDWENVVVSASSAKDKDKAKVERERKFILRRLLRCFKKQLVFARDRTVEQGNNVIETNRNANKVLAELLVDQDALLTNTGYSIDPESLIEMRPCELNKKFREILEWRRPQKTVTTNKVITNYLQETLFLYKRLRRAEKQRSNISADARQQVVESVKHLDHEDLNFTYRFLFSQAYHVKKVPFYPGFKTSYEYDRASDVRSSVRLIDV